VSKGGEKQPREDGRGAARKAISEDTDSIEISSGGTVLHNPKKQSTHITWRIKK
jgi:hypothetical protein